MVLSNKLVFMADQTVSPDLPGREDYVSWTAAYREELKDVCKELNLPRKFVRVLLTPTSGERRHSVQENVYNAHLSDNNEEQAPEAELMKRAFRYRNKNPYTFFGSLWTEDISLKKTWKMADDNNKNLMTNVFNREEICPLEEDIGWEKYK